MAMLTTITEEELGAIISFKPEITYNTNRTFKRGKKAPNGIEIRFGSVRPTEEVREKLKEFGFKFSERQVMWYAIDTTKSRELVAYLESNEIQADDTQYEKRYLWAKITSMEFYHKLGSYTEFMIGGTPPQFFRNKKQLEASNNVRATIYNDLLKFKKFYNKIIGEEGEEAGEETENEQETEEEENEDADEEDYQKPTDSRNHKPDLLLADKLEKLADGMQKEIDSKLNSATSRQRPTAKRLRVAAGMRSTGYYLLNIQKVLYALSKAHRQGTIHSYQHLKHITSKSQVELLNKYANVHSNREEDHYLQSVLNNNSKVFQQLGINTIQQWESAFHQKEELIKRFSDSSEEINQELRLKMEELEIKIKSLKIEGFFPTPKKLIDELIAIAEIKNGESVLEPSAGKGDILDGLSAQFGDAILLSACEVNSTLRELLTLKGYDLVGTDFLQHVGTYDKIIMNPPFEKGRDIDHVLHAYDLLNAGGRVVAIMGEGTFFRSFKKEKEFTNFLFERNAYISQKIEGVFKNAFNQTGIAVRIVAINKDGTLPDIDDILETGESDIEEDTDDMELLELEAQAELELLKMELELKQKKQNLNGLGDLQTGNIYPDVWDIH